MKTLFITILLLGCSGRVVGIPAPEESKEVVEELPTGVRTFYDQKHGIRCYTFWGDAISCIAQNEGK